MKHLLILTLFALVFATGASADLICIGCVGMNNYTYNCSACHGPNSYGQDLGNGQYCGYCPIITHEQAAVLVDLKKKSAAEWHSPEGLTEYGASFKTVTVFVGQFGILETLTQRFNRSGSESVVKELHRSLLETVDSGCRSRIMREVVEHLRNK